MRDRATAAGRRIKLGAIGVALLSLLADCRGSTTGLIDETCLDPLRTEPERAVLVVGDTVVFTATYLRGCDIRVPFRWMVTPAFVGAFSIRSDTSALFTAQASGFALVDIRDPNGKTIGQASVEVRVSGQTASASIRRTPLNGHIVRGRDTDRPLCPNAPSACPKCYGRDSINHVAVRPERRSGSRARVGGWALACCEVTTQFNSVLHVSGTGFADARRRLSRTTGMGCGPPSEDTSANSVISRSARFAK